MRTRLVKRRLRVELRCRKTAVCAGTIRAVALRGRLARPLLLAQRAFRVHRGGPRIVHVKLGPRGRKRLARYRRIRVTAYRGKVRVATTWATYQYRVPSTSHR
jgi:hypothetical protein